MNFSNQGSSPLTYLRWVHICMQEYYFLKFCTLRMLIYVSWRCWVFLCRGRHGKNTLAGVEEKFEHTLFNFVQMSTKLICKVWTVVFNLPHKNSIVPVVSTNLMFFLKFSLPQLIINSSRPWDHRAMLVVANARKKYLAKNI